MSVYPSGLASELSLYKLCCKGGPAKLNSITNSIAELPKGPVDLVRLNFTILGKVSFSLLDYNLLGMQ